MLPLSSLLLLPLSSYNKKELPSGVSYREYRSGKGNKIVQKGSTVVVEMTVRCKSFPTGNEPGGVKYYSTKDDTPYNALEWTLGSGLIILSITTYCLMII